MGSRTRIRFLLSILLIAYVGFVGAGCSRSIADADPVLFPDPIDNTITFWGHACVYIDVDGYGIVTDPVFQKTTDWRRRKVPAPPPSSYENTGVILVSHGHNDHLSRNTIRTFPETATVLCSEPSAKYLKDIPQDIKIMKIGDEFEYPGGKIVAVAALHTGGRFGFSVKADGRALGFIVYTPQSVIYYSGDTNYWRGIDDIGVKYAPDVTILNVNGHLHSTDAVLAAFATTSETVIPAHFGAYGYLWVDQQKVPRNYHKIENILEPVLLFLNLGENAPLNGRRGLRKHSDLP